MVARQSPSQRGKAESLFLRAQRAFEKGQRLALCGKPQAAERWLQRANGLLEQAGAIVGEPIVEFTGWAGGPPLREPRAMTRQKPKRVASE